LSSASFQDTARVLVKAIIRGKEIPQKRILKFKKFAKTRRKVLFFLCLKRKKYHVFTNLKKGIK
jgi:hypothetical protein